MTSNSGTSKTDLYLNNVLGQSHIARGYTYTVHCQSLDQHSILYDMVTPVGVQIHVPCIKFA